MQAVRAALGEAGVTLKDCDHRIADVNGEQYRFKEAALAITRLLRDRKVLFSLWHPADCIGEVGASTLPAILAMLSACRKDYLPGPICLGHIGNDDDKRAASVTQALSAQTLSLEFAAETAFRGHRGQAADGQRGLCQRHGDRLQGGGGQIDGRLPDTCLSPPSPPAGPVPLPYPNTAFASDTTNGSTTVMISGQESC